MYSYFTKLRGYAGVIYKTSTSKLKKFTKFAHAISIIVREYTDNVEKDVSEVLLRPVEALNRFEYAKIFLELEDRV